MKITVHSSKAVKPAYDFNGGAVAPPATTTTATVPLTVFDRVNFDTYISVIYAFHPPSPPNAALETGLAKVLSEYREWAGRLGAMDSSGNNSAILLTDDGARFVEATADVALSAVMPLQPTPAVLSLHPTADDGNAEELMLIQLTRFACGSLVVGFTTHHLVADGRATGNFFLAWSQATRGARLDPPPFHDRASLFVPRHPPVVQFDHRAVEFKPSSTSCENHHSAESGGGGDEVVVVHRAHFSREFIGKLKSAAGAPPRPYSTVQCVVAHLWRCVTAARGLGESQRTTTVRVAVDGRARMTRPRVPEGYTGNVVLWARPSAVAGDLVAAPLGRAAALVRAAVARVDDAYFRSFVDFASSSVFVGAAVEEEEREERLVAIADAAGMVLSPDVEVDSWLRIPFYDLDFGGGRPFFFMPSYLPVEGLIILLPSFAGDGSVDAYVTLFSRHMDTFKNCCYSIAKDQ